MAEAVDVAKVGAFGMSGTEALQKIWQILLSARDGNFPLSVDVGSGSGLVIPTNDYQAFTYYGSTNNIQTIVYKQGGSGGTTVATLTFAYAGGGAADDDLVTSITLT